MRILALSDTHFGYEYGRTKEAKKEQVKWSFDVFEHVLDLAIEENVDLVLHAGDMFNRSKPKKEIVSRAYNLLNQFIQSDIDFVAIPGNHDRSHLPETLITHLSKKIRFMNKLSEIKYQNLSVIGFPFEAKNPVDLFNRIQRFIQGNSNRNYIVFCHQLFEGACFGPHNHVFTNRTDTIEVNKSLENLLLVLSGHVHRSQCIQDGKVWYTGSILRTSFMELVESKGFLIIDLEDDVVDAQFHKLPSYPMKVFELDITETHYISSKIDSLEINPLMKTMLRLTGRPLSVNEIKFLWARFPAKEYPLLRFSPRYPNYSLKSLFKSTQVACRGY